VLKMKKTFFAGCVALTIFTTAFFAGCDFQAAQDAFDEFNVIVALEDINTTVSVKFIDPVQDSFIESEVLMRFEGNNKSDIIDTFSDPMTEANVTGGIGGFGIKNSVVPSSGSPVTVQIIASAPGYDSGSGTVQISEVGLTEVTINMTRTGQAVQSGATAQSAATTSGGTVSQPSTATTDSGSSANQTTASVTLPAGTSARTSSGQAASGTIQTNVSFFTNADGSGASAFPGGFTPTVQNASGVSSQQSMTTAGFAKVTVRDTNGNNITQFDPPIPLTVTIPPTTINQTAGRPIQNGDQIQVFSFVESGAKWVAEGNATVSGPGPNGNFSVTYMTNHLSNWNFGYASDGCSSGNFSLNRNGNAGAATLRVSSSDGSWVSSDIVVAADKSTFTVQKAPLNLTGYVIQNQAGDQVGTGTGSICGATGSATLPAPASNLIDVTFQLNFGATCKRLNVANLGPDVNVYYRKQGEPASAARSFTVTDANLTKLQGTISGGSVVVPGLQSGATYLFNATIDNKAESRTEVVTGSVVTIDVSAEVDGICIK